MRVYYEYAVKTFTQSLALTGNIAGDLIRPISFPLSIASDQIGQALFRFVFTVVPTIIISTI